MKICKTCGTKAANAVISCYGCNHNHFIDVIDGETTDIGTISNPVNEEYGNCQLRFSGPNPGWTIESNGIFVMFPGFGVIRPGKLFVDKGVEILSSLPGTKMKIERAINHAVSQNHIIEIDHVVIYGDKVIEEYHILFDVDGSYESTADYPFTEIYAQFDCNDNMKIILSYA